MPVTMVDTQKVNKEYSGLNVSSVSLVGGNTDGKTLFLTVEVFDGANTNRFEVEFPINTTSTEITNYMIEVIEDSPKLPTEIIQMMQRRVYWDAIEQGWYSQVGNGRPARLKDQDHRADKYKKAQDIKDAAAAKQAQEDAAALKKAQDEAAHKNK